MSPRVQSARTASTSSLRSPAASARPCAWHTRRARSTSASCSAAWSSRVSASQLPHRSRACATTSTSTATSCSPKTRGPAWSSTTESSGPPTNRDSVSEKKYLILAEALSHDPHYAKTARGVMRYRRDSVVVMLDSNRVGEGEDGVPIFGTVGEALDFAPNTALVGVATPAGRFPGDWQELLKSCVVSGLDL